MADVWAGGSKVAGIDIRVVAEVFVVSVVRV